MDTRKAKKTRSYGEPSQGPPDSHVSRSSASVSRPGPKERSLSAPLVAQVPQAPPCRDGATQHITSIPVAHTIFTSIGANEDIDIDSGQPCSPLVSNIAEKENLLPIPATLSKVELRNSMLQLNFAVLGAAGAGKSNFIRCALDLKTPATSALSSKKMSLEGEVFVISLLEMNLEFLKISESQEIQWPHDVEGIPISRLDGVFIVYDVTNRESLSKIPSLLNACSRERMPCVLASCKCDCPPDTWLIDPRTEDRICNSSALIETFQTSIKNPQVHKRCISVILRYVISEKPFPQTRAGPTRPRALTTSLSPDTLFSPHCIRPTAKHGRAASEMSGSLSQKSNLPVLATMSLSAGVKFGTENVKPTHGIEHALGLPEAHSFGLSSQAARILPRSGDVTSNPTEGDTQAYQPTSVEFSLLKQTLKAPDGILSTTPGVSIKKENMPEEGERLSIEDFSSLPADIRPVVSDTRAVGLTFNDLVDRLLSQPMSKSDTKFKAVFLCLYRKFAAPAELMSAIISRFEDADKDQHPQIQRLGSQLRHLGILAKWLSEYPGDFAHHSTRQRISVFIAGLETSRVFAVAAKEMFTQLELVSEDDDTEWACSDIVVGARACATEQPLDNIRAPIQGKYIPLDSSQEDTDITVCDSNSKNSTLRHSKSPSSSSSTGLPSSYSESSLSTVLSPVEAARRQAQLLTPVARNPLTKVHWHEFMEISGEDIARELTRIDWIMFSSIRPRDLVRHVSLSIDQKEKCKSLENVNRMISQFQHVAFWVANIILLRDKPKHRAKALEKFMSLAWKLRQLNNYNSLGAVIAGINGTAVYRLAQTRELVSQQIQKDFMRLEILMGTQKSHFAYRLAWENTSSERIPFLPIHRRDLVSAEEGNQTFVGEKLDRINWKKFEVMGDIIVGLQKSQGTPYPNITRNPEVQRLMLDGKFPKDEDELYERSIQLERPRVGESNRMFNWFQR